MRVKLKHMRLTPQPRAAVVFQAFWLSLLGSPGFHPEI